MSKAAEKNVVAEICLYGSNQVGAGWLANTSPLNANSKLFGTGEPKHGYGFTHAMFEACEALAMSGVNGFAWVFEPNGKKKALVNINQPVWYGNLQWQPAEQYVISMQEVLAAAE